MVTQPSISHHMLCVQCESVCMRALLCLVFIIAVHIGNEVYFYQLSTLTLQVTVNSAMSHRPFQVPLCHRHDAIVTITFTEQYFMVLSKDLFYLNVYNLFLYLMYV